MGSVSHYKNKILSTERKIKSLQEQLELYKEILKKQRQHNSYHTKRWREKNPEYYKNWYKENKK